MPKKTKIKIVHCVSWPKSFCKKIFVFSVVPLACGLYFSFYSLECTAYDSYSTNFTETNLRILKAKQHIENDILFINSMPRVTSKKKLRNAIIEKRHAIEILSHKRVKSIQIKFTCSVKFNSQCKVIILYMIRKNGFHCLWLCFRNYLSITQMLTSKEKHKEN